MSELSPLPKEPQPQPQPQPPYLIYTVCFEYRRIEQMWHRFRGVGIDPNDVYFYRGVAWDEPRMQADPTAHPYVKRVWSLSYGHLDLIRRYYDQTAGLVDPPLGIITEDDVLLRHDFVPQMARVVRDFRAMKLDILLLGYLCSNPIDTYSNFHSMWPEYVDQPSLPSVPSVPSQSATDFKYFNYTEDTWGAQMYMITREHAGLLLAKYEHGYLERTIADPSCGPPFNPDWFLTKEGRRDGRRGCVLYPLMAIEDGLGVYDDEGHAQSHRNCHRFSYRPELFFREGDATLTPTPTPPPLPRIGSQ